LMMNIQSGDELALGAPYDATVGKIYARVMRITGNPSDADEVTIDVYLQAWQSAQQFDPHRGTPLQWLMAIARSRALDCYRKRAVHHKASYLNATLVGSDSIAPVHEPLYEHEVERVLCVLLPQLNPVQSRVIGLAFFDGLSHREIAECTRMPLGTVKSHLCRALLTLRKAMKTRSVEALS